MRGKSTVALFKSIARIIILTVPIILLVGLVAGLLTSGLYGLTRNYFSESTTNYIVGGLTVLGITIFYLTKKRTK